MRFRSIARAGFALTIVFSWVGGFAAGATAAPEQPLVGYWGTDAAGLIRRSGDAPDLGDLRGVHLNAPIVGIAATSSGRGFWLAAADGGVFSFGDARFYGSAANLHLNAPIVGVAAASGSRYSDRGYWLAAADGGVFTFGDATFHGSAANLHLNAPVVSIALGGGGYRLAASDGGVFTYGATFSGTSTRTPVSAITTSPFGGYVMQSSTGGGLSAFGNGSACAVDVPARLDSTHPYVGVAGAFDPGRGDVEGAMANVSCPVGGGHTGAFRPLLLLLSRWGWHIDVIRTGTDPACFTEVFGLDRVGTQPVPTRPLVAKYGSIVMRSTQTAGHSVFDVRVTGTNCRAVASNSVFRIFVLPLAATTRAGDIGPFTTITPPGPRPFTLKAHGTCTTEVRESGDGSLVQRKTGSSYTMAVTSGGYWISNTPGCTVSIT